MYTFSMYPWKQPPRRAAKIYITVFYFQDDSGVIPGYGDNIR